MKVSDFLARYEQVFRDRIEEVFRQAGLRLDLDLREISQKHFEAIAHFAIEKLSEDERRRLYEDLMRRLREEGSELPEKLAVKVFPKELPLDKRRGFDEVYFKVELDEARLEAARCLRCRTPRCVEACPLGFPVPAFLKAVADGRIDAAYQMAFRLLPTLGTCGRICIGYCEKACTLRQLGEKPLRIRAVKRAVADAVSKKEKIPKPKPSTGFKVAIVGSGPAGLAAAHYLRLLGHEVTVFEVSDRLGGQLTESIPEFRLPSKVVEEEIELIKELGVKFEKNRAVGRDVTIDDLLNEGYNAVFIATGAAEPRNPRIKGMDLKGVHLGMELLKSVKRGKEIRLSGKVLVIGGGNVAMDAARTALRLGADEVAIMYRRSREEMPAEDEEIEEVTKEGVKITFLVQPVELIGQDGKLKKVKFIRMKLGEPGPDGRRRPIPIENSEFEVDADHIIFAIGQRPSITWISEKDGIELNDDGTIKVNDRLETTRRGVFAGGDVVRGPATYTIATADGIKAAKEIDRYLRSLPVL